MDVVYFKSKKGNFGDDLNEWLWPQIFPNILLREDYIFLGIGTILDEKNIKNFNLKEKKKIIFGTGLRYPNSFNIPKHDKTWDIRFVRGPLSSSFLNNCTYITDAAYSLRYLNYFKELKNTQKKYAISVMPYFTSTQFYDWEKICLKLGYHYISPHSEHGVDFTLKEIAASNILLTEAMHGAIVADIMRVPWSRFILSTYYNENPFVSEFKWSDWLLSIGLNNVEKNFIELYRRNRISDYIRNFTYNIISVQFFKKSKCEYELLHKLSNIKTTYNSDDSVIYNIDSSIGEKIETLKNDYNI